MASQGRLVPVQQRTADTPPEAALPTPADAWRGGQLYRLPSGHCAQLRRPGLMAMLATGQIPNPLAQQVMRLLTVTTTEEIAQRTREQREEALRSNSEAFVAIAELCFVAPRLVTDHPPDYSADEIGAADLSDRDLLWLYYDFVEGTAQDVATFRVA